MSNNRMLCKMALTLLLILMGIGVSAQGISRSDIMLGYSQSSNVGRIYVSSVRNNASVAVNVQFINEYDGRKRSITLQSGEQRSPGITCNIVQAWPQSGGRHVTIFSAPKPVEEQEPVLDVSEAPLETTQTSSSRDDTEGKSNRGVSNKNDSVSAKTERAKAMLEFPRKNSYTSAEVIDYFYSFIDSKPYYSSHNIETERKLVEEHVNNLKNWRDRNEYIRENRLMSYVRDNRDSLVKYTKQASSLVDEYFDKLLGNHIENKQVCEDSIRQILSERLGQHEYNIKLLSAELGRGAEIVDDGRRFLGIIVGVSVVIFAIVLIIIIWRVKKRRGKQVVVMQASQAGSAANGASTIIVRRKTTSILKKQSLEDVIGNDSYLKIDCKDFCDDSAVRRIYIKNTCIKDIYNMYADDLRNPDNPKEDGCMVLGRWVCDGEAKEYYVSLEYIVRPGDDAVLSEYELNFGGKIKLKVAEKLRKLRRETNLQYDLTCWVHSHPGLGVFFSNSDNNVQMQLKSPLHPEFLTAIVVDILTPQQETGIFTFKHDSTMNSKIELKKMYSLEELYKWAVESERNSFKPADYYNALSEVEAHLDKCYGIELSNGAVIDICMLATERAMGFVGKVYGYGNSQGLWTEYVVNTVSKGNEANGNDLVGCFVIAPHCSIPSICKAVAAYLNDMRFVMVYTPGNGLLTSIPVIDNNLCTDVKYYGEQKLEDLRIWTRRKR